MICGRQGDDGTLLQSFDGDACECPDEEFFDAGLKALFRAFGAASEAMLEGEEERGGAERLGGGGNVMLTLLEPLLFVGIRDNRPFRVLEEFSHPVMVVGVGM